MTAEEAWKKIITGLSKEAGDFKTVPRNRREPVWFYAMSDGHSIYVDSAREEKPSSKLSSARKILYSDFEIVYEHYTKWQAGLVGVRGEVSKKSRNTAYIFGLISYYSVS